MTKKQIATGSAVAAIAFTIGWQRPFAQPPSPAAVAQVSENAKSAWKPTGLIWVTVLNERGINSGNGYFAKGDTCSIDQRGDVTEVDMDHHNIKYSIRGTQYGARCPSGVIFSLKEGEGY